MSQHKIIIIDKNSAQDANAFCNEIGADGESFTVKLFNGNNTHTHLMCGWLMNDEQYASVQEYFEHIFDDVDDALLSLGLKREQPNP